MYCDFDIVFYDAYSCSYFIFYFFLNVTATTEIYTYGHTLSLHDALPICRAYERRADSIGDAEHGRGAACGYRSLEETSPTAGGTPGGRRRDRKSTRLNSSH